MQGRKATIIDLVQFYSSTFVIMLTYVLYYCYYYCYYDYFMIIVITTITITIAIATITITTIIVIAITIAIAIIVVVVVVVIIIIATIITIINLTSFRSNIRTATCSVPLASLNGFWRKSTTRRERWNKGTLLISSKYTRKYLFSWMLWLRLMISKMHV